MEAAVADARAHARCMSYESYLVTRLERSLNMAETAPSDRERKVHLLTCRYYCDLLGRVHPDDALTAME